MYSLWRSQYPRGLRRRSSAARLLRLWVRIPPGYGCLSVVCCQVEVSATSWSLVQRRTVARLCVWFRNLVNEEAMAHWGEGGAVAPKQTNKMYSSWRVISFTLQPLSPLDSTGGTFSPSGLESDFPNPWSPSPLPSHNRDWATPGSRKRKSWSIMRYVPGEIEAYSEK